MNLLCKALGHKHQRNHVWYDGVDYRASCYRCATDLIRDYSTNDWRPYSDVTDTVDGRSIKPVRH